MNLAKQWAALFVLALAVPCAALADSHKKGDPEKGKEVFESKCTVCHNADSKEKKIGPGLKGVSEGKLPSGKEATFENVMKNLNEGGGGMPAFEKLLEEEQKQNVVAYVLTL